MNYRKLGGLGITARKTIDPFTAIHSFDSSPGKQGREQLLGTCSNKKNGRASSRQRGRRNGRLT